MPVAEELVDNTRSVKGREKLDAVELDVGNLGAIDDDVLTGPTRCKGGSVSGVDRLRDGEDIPAVLVVATHPIAMDQRDSPGTERRALIVSPCPPSKSRSTAPASTEGS